MDLTYLPDMIQKGAAETSKEGKVSGFFFGCSGLVWFDDDVRVKRKKKKRTNKV